MARTLNLFSNVRTKSIADDVRVIGRSSKLERRGAEDLEEVGDAYAAHDHQFRGKTPISRAQGTAWNTERRHTSPRTGRCPEGEGYRELPLHPPQRGQPACDPTGIRREYIAHVRFDTRTPPRIGKKVLFLQELQSDWHAKWGRDQGFAKKARAPEEVKSRTDQELNEADAHYANVGSQARSSRR